MDTHSFPTTTKAPLSIRTGMLSSDHPMQIVMSLLSWTTTDTFSATFRGYPVYLANTSGDTCWLNAEDSRLDLTTQAQGKDGKWKDIDYLPSSWCGNSYHQLARPYYPQNIMDPYYD